MSMPTVFWPRRLHSRIKNGASTDIRIHKEVTMKKKKKKKNDIYTGPKFWQITQKPAITFFVAEYFGMTLGTLNDDTI